MTNWKSWASACLALLVAGCGASWQEYNSKEGKYSVLFPGAPKNQDKAASGMKVQGAGVEKKDAGYMVMYADLPPSADPLKTPEQLEMRLDAAAEGSIRNVKGKKTGDKIKLGEYSGREVRADIEANKELRARLYVVKNRLYTVMVMGYKGMTTNADADKFFNSFKLAD